MLWTWVGGVGWLVVERGLVGTGAVGEVGRAEGAIVGISGSVWEVDKGVGSGDSAARWVDI